MAGPKIDSYAFGEIVIDGRRYRHDVIILPDGVLPDWWRLQGHSLAVEDLAPVLKAAPRTLVVGLGAQGRMQVPEATRRALEGQGIELLALSTAEACQVYNRLRHSGDTAAALHLTC